jgi:hypothetical protein
VQKQATTFEVHNGTRQRPIGGENLLTISKEQKMTVVQVPDGFLGSELRDS